MICKVILAFAFVAACGTVAAVKDVPKFTVNLDLPPQERWTEVTLYWQDHIVGVADAVSTAMQDQFNETITEEWVSLVSASLSDDHREELQGILDTLHGAGKTDFTLADLYMANFIYNLESPTMCSGFLAAMPNGTVIHGRNMDYAIHFTVHGEELNWPDVTYEVEFMRDGEHLFTSINWPGQVGVHTAMRPGGWTFEQNTRHNNDLWDNFEALRAGGKYFELEIRSIMESTASFEDALQTITSTNFAAPQYFIMAGAQAYEGAVVTIDRGGRRLPGTPPVQRLNQAASTWHLVQTNDDLNKAPQDPRRPAANLILEPLESNDVVDFNFVESFMISPPLFNPMTVFTFVSVPATGYHVTLARPEAQAIELAMSTESEGEIALLQGKNQESWSRHSQNLARMKFRRFKDM